MVRNDPLIQKILYSLDNEIKSIGEPVLRGSVADFNTYKAITGRIAGLEQAKLVVLECCKRYSEDEDDDFNFD